jgi:tetratricopeptide (TPR) repeat protein
MKIRTLFAFAVAMFTTTAVCAGAAPKRFEWTTQSAEARNLLTELQTRIETFQVGQANLDLAKRIVGHDPEFAMGQYYLSAVTPGADAEKAQAIGPKSPRIEVFLANDDLLKGDYAKARGTYEAVEKSLPKGSVPFAIRFGVTFSRLYQGNVDAALESLRTYLVEYKAGGLDQQFPEVFIWNAMARINLENGRLDEAMKDYQKGYESVPGSNLPDDQKQIWSARLRHGKARVMAKQGKRDEAWSEAEAIKRMIEEGGEAGKQYWPSYHDDGFCELMPRTANPIKFF